MNIVVIAVQVEILNGKCRPPDHFAALLSSCNKFFFNFKGVPLFDVILSGPGVSLTVVFSRQSQVLSGGFHFKCSLASQFSGPERPRLLVLVKLRD